MTKPRRGPGTYFAESLEAELRNLRLQVEQLQDKLKEANRKVRDERWRATLIEEKLAVSHKEEERLKDKLTTKDLQIQELRDQQQWRAQQAHRMNGVTA